MTNNISWSSGIFDVSYKLGSWVWHTNCQYHNKATDHILNVYFAHVHKGRSEKVWNGIAPSRGLFFHYLVQKEWGSRK